MPTNPTTHLSLSFNATAAALRNLAPVASAAASALTDPPRGHSARVSGRTDPTGETVALRDADPRHQALAAKMTAIAEELDGVAAMVADLTLELDDLLAA